MKLRYPAQPNTIKLNLDFDTLDRLRAHAKERQLGDLTRYAYELLQEALSLRVAPSAPSSVTSETDLTFDWRAGCAPLKRES